jgi:hypothetical protein
MLKRFRSKPLPSAAGDRAGTPVVPAPPGRFSVEATVIGLEIKKYLLAYRRVLFGLLSSALTCLLLLLAVSHMLERQSLFEPFSVGVVDEGDSPEVRMIFDFLSEAAVRLEYLTKTEADVQLRRGEIPAYVQLPEHFARDIISGANAPFILYGNNDMPLQYSLARLLASGGVAFLSASQAGIYATIDYALEQGLTWDFINRYILFPVNVSFIRQLLEYEQLFMAEVLPLTQNISPVTHYIFCFTAFLLLLNLLSVTRILTGYSKAVYDRFKLAGWPVYKVQLIRLAGLLAVNILLTAPLYGLAMHITSGGTVISGLALAFCVSGFGLLAAGLFRSNAACGLFVFITSSVMLFAAGGIVPLAFLPRAYHGMRYFTIPYWAAEQSAVMPAMMGLLFILLAFLAEMRRAR